MLLHLDEVRLAFAGSPILDGVSLRLDENTRLGLVGRNGAGKSTLLRILVGDLAPDAGRIHRRRDLSIGWLEQMDPRSEETVLESALEPFAELKELEAELRRLEPLLASGDGALLERYGHLQERWERRGAFVAEAQAKKVLSGLGFSEKAFDQQVARLSGGERTRLGLARLLLTAPDLMLLDEPTNHLDLGAVEFLEQTIAGYPGAVVVSSHDRAFLDAFADEIAEIDKGHLTHYTGNFSAYQEQRELARKQRAEAFERQKAHIAKTEDFIRRNIAGQATKQAQARRKMLAKLERVEDVREERSAAIRIASSGRSELEVIAAEDLRLEVEGRILLGAASFSVHRQERVGIVGPNGSGKSTLLKALLGKRRPDGGHVRIGGKVSVGYHDQELSSVDPQRTVLEELGSTRPSWPTEALRAHAGRFLFSGDEAERRIATMSGGERTRACLAKLTLAGFNLLVLDEPTNHLDAAAREALESALDDYDGTLICVSHDRWFLERSCDRILWISQEPTGAILEDHRGSFLEAKATREENVARASTPTSANLRSTGKEENEKRRALANAKKAAERRIIVVDREIALLEDEVGRADRSLQDPALATDYLALAESQKAKDAAEDRILELLEEREQLVAATRIEAEDVAPAASR